MNGCWPFCARVTNPHGAAHRSVNESPLVIVAGSAVKLVIGCGALAVQAVTVGAGVGVGTGVGAGVDGPVGPEEHAAAVTATKRRTRQAHALPAIVCILNLRSGDSRLSFIERYSSAPALSKAAGRLFATPWRRP
jgi:hypothetical protein